MKFRSTIRQDGEQTKGVGTGPVCLASESGRVERAAEEGAPSPTLYRPSLLTGLAAALGEALLASDKEEELKFGRFEQVGEVGSADGPLCQACTWPSPSGPPS